MKFVPMISGRKVSLFRYILTWTAVICLWGVLIIGVVSLIYGLFGRLS